MYEYFVYIATNKANSVLYTGVTNNIYRRMFEHAEKENPNCFTAKYNVNKLVYVEKTSYVNNALTREKQIKGLTRQKKIDLINAQNPEWADLLKNFD
jgi:putative endonuclease